MLDWCLHFNPRVLQLYLGPYLNKFWTPSGVDLEYIGLSGQFDLARRSENLWQFYGCLYIEWDRRGPSCIIHLTALLNEIGDDAACHHC